MAVGLYPQLLGSAWNDLHEAVRRLHAEAAPVQAAGSFRIRRGKGPVARWLLTLLGLPPAGEAVPIRLTISLYGNGEKWLRTFGDRPLVTTQRPGGRSLLAERFGTLELRFRLQVQGGALVYQQTGAALRLARISIPLPGWLTPKVAAREEPGGGPNQTRVCVRVVFPWVGLLISYEGIMTREETP
jgi:hypothetical protein